jgi:hypothetical protein
MLFLYLFTKLQTGIDRCKNFWGARVASMLNRGLPVLTDSSSFLLSQQPSMTWFMFMFTDRENPHKSTRGRNSNTPKADWGNNDRELIEYRPNLDLGPDDRNDSDFCCCCWS